MKFLITIIISLVVVITSAIPILQEWNEYKVKYRKSYLGYDDIVHRVNYIANKNRIVLHNRRFDRKLVKYKLGVGQYTDLNTIQFNQMLGGLRIIPTSQMNPTTTVRPSTTTVSPQPTFPPPIYRNWILDGAVTEVKDQGTNCNAAWAFAALGALEGHHFVRYMKLPPSLSVENILDCSGAQKLCSGDQTPDKAYEYIINNQNVNSELVYPYTGYPGICRYNQNDFGTTLGGYERIAENDDKYLYEIVAFQGPVVVGFDPFSFDFQHYESGIYEPPRKLFNNTGRYFMAVVGYGHDVVLNTNYWILKNSMGVHWGEKGFIRVIRDSRNPIAKCAMFPNV